MLTIAKLALYEDYRGDSDMWARGRYTDAMTLAEWNLIEELLNRLRLQGSGLTATSFDAQTDRILAENAENEDVIVPLRAMAKR